MERQTIVGVSRQQKINSNEYLNEKEHKATTFF